MLANEEGRADHTPGHAERSQYLQRQRKVIPDVGITRHAASLTLESAWSSVKQTAQLHRRQVTVITTVREQCCPMEDRNTRERHSRRVGASVAVFAQL
jgi:hypothetical protein